MAVKKLSSNIQSLFSSSIYLFSYKRAVEELVYNALDAKSTSIAIRIHIQENKIQVVDNGNGISKQDFTLLGQRYATSKFVDMSRFQSVPDTYGFRGQTLASIVDVSKCVKITSRLNNTEETWTKTFYKGKDKQTDETTVRPSKGTTVEINGFLYNMKIQNKSINYFNELNDIKILLEQLSLVHNNVSFSLRDDSRNEIVFKVQKNRDIYQTFKSLHAIEKSDLQELQVEKGQYKATAYFSKQREDINGHHWIFLNKRIVRSTCLHKFIQRYLTKSRQDTKFKKHKPNNGHDCDMNKEVIPQYFIFITCPYYDYEISNTPKQSSLEFKNWDQINKLVEKLVKFYTGDLKVNEVKKICNKDTSAVLNGDDTREKVKGIMKKILGSYPKNPGVSQMQNGIKGKLIKRKKKTPKENVLPKAQDLIDCSTNHEININNNISHLKLNKVLKRSKGTQLKRDNQITKSSNRQYNHKHTSNTSSKGIRENKCRKLPKLSTKNYKLKKPKFKRDPLIKAFEKGSDTVVRRCDMLAKQVKDLIPSSKKEQKDNQRIFVNTTINYSTITKDNETISVRKRVQETIIHDYIPLRPITDLKCKKLKTASKKDFKTSHDLVKTVLHSCEDVCFPAKVNKDRQFKKANEYLEVKNQVSIPQLTYQSHNYINRTPSPHKDDVNNENNFHELCEGIRKTNFIGKYSVDNFVEPEKSLLQPKHSRLPIFIHKRNKERILANKNTKITKFKKTKKIDFSKYSNATTIHTIDFSESKEDHNSMSKINDSELNLYTNDKNFECDLDELHTAGTVALNIGVTFTQPNDSPPNNTNILCKDGWTQQPKSPYCKTKEITSNDHEQKKQLQDSLNIIFVSNSNSSPFKVIQDSSHSDNIEPLNICETILSAGTNNIMSEELVASRTPNEFSDSFLKSHTSEHFNKKSNQEYMPQPKIPSENIIVTNITLEDEINNVAYAVEDMENFLEENVGDHYNTLTLNNQSKVIVKNQKHEDNEIGFNFNIKNRLRFLPKGMSPIFKKHNLQNLDDLNFETDYFQEEIYNRFLESVQMNSEIYEAHVQNPRDKTTKAIHKVSSRLNKDNSSLTFNTQSLQEAKVLGQVDNKFIATVMKGKSGSSEFLVLFDQHAVHERIRLEDNLADYYNGNEWKCANLDDLVLKLSKDEILYLHNHKDKFTPFGLNWTVLNNHEIKLHTVPEAILGKNPRQVDKVINAVRNLISEEVNIIKSQRGCSSVYPKSIMDLVFSEACRYAIMFGDSLSKSDCIALIQNLSSCKTPFQCAHGRPVMAVLLEITSETRHYQINKEKLRCLNKQTN